MLILLGKSCTPPPRHYELHGFTMLHGNDGNGWQQGWYNRLGYHPESSEHQQSWWQGDTWPTEAQSHYNAVNPHGEHENSIDDEASDKSLSGDAAEIVDDPETISGGAPVTEAEAQRNEPNDDDAKNDNNNYGDKNLKR